MPASIPSAEQRPATGVVARGVQLGAEIRGPVFTAVEQDRHSGSQRVALASGIHGRCEDREGRQDCLDRPWLCPGRMVVVW